MIIIMKAMASAVTLDQEAGGGGCWGHPQAGYHTRRSNIIYVSAGVPTSAKTLLTRVKTRPLISCPRPD